MPTTATTTDIKILKNQQLARDTGAVSYTVYRDGDIIGRVDKGTRETFASALIGADPATAWYGYDRLGELVTSSFGEDTRKRAVHLVGQAAQPLVVRDVKIAYSPIAGVPFIEARVDWAGNTLFVSRYADEDGWTVDALFNRGSSCPVFSNGAGTRFTARNVLTELPAAAVDAEVARLGISL